jgi:hypothetical protein
MIVGEKVEVQRFTGPLVLWSFGPWHRLDLVVLGKRSKLGMRFMEMRINLK